MLLNTLKYISRINGGKCVLLLRFWRRVGKDIANISEPIVSIEFRLSHRNSPVVRDDHIDCCSRVNLRLGCFIVAVSFTQQDGIGSDTTGILIQLVIVYFSCCFCCMGNKNE